MQQLRGSMTRYIKILMIEKFFPLINSRKKNDSNILDTEQDNEKYFQQYLKKKEMQTFSFYVNYINPQQVEGAH